METAPEDYTVMIVDDAPAVREALRWALEDAGGLVVVGEASDGVEAIARAAALRPDVIILDIELPRLDGYAVARAVKGRPDPPVVIFLTIHSDAASRQHCAEAGGDDFSEKGEGWGALIGRVRRALAAHRR